MAMLVFPDTPPYLEHLCMGAGKPGPPVVLSCWSPSHPAWSPCLDPVHAVAAPLAAAPKFLLSDLELPALGTDAGGKAYTRKAFPASCAFGKLMGLVWLCLGGDGKPIPAKQTFYYGLFWFFSPFSFCTALSVL